MMSKIRRITNSVAYPKNLKIKEGATYFPKKISDLIHFQDFLLLPTMFIPQVKKKFYFQQFKFTDTHPNSHVIISSFRRFWVQISLC